MSAHEFWAVLAILAFAAFVIVACLRLADDLTVVRIERAFAFVILAGALGGAGYVLASGVSALDEAATSVSGTTSTSNSTASSASNSTATSSASEPIPSVDPSSSESSAGAHSAQSGNVSSSTPPTQAVNSDPTDLLRDLMLFVFAFAMLGVLLLVGGIPWIRPSRRTSQLGDDG